MVGAGNRRLALSLALAACASDGPMIENTKAIKHTKDYLIFLSKKKKKTRQQSPSPLARSAPTLPSTHVPSRAALAAVARIGHSWSSLLNYSR